MQFTDFKTFERAIDKDFRDRIRKVYLSRVSDAEFSKSIREVYEDVINGQYAPDKPIEWVHQDKGKGVVRAIPVFHIKDYIIYYFCVKQLQDILVGQRVPNTYGAWSFAGPIRARENLESEQLSEYYSTFSYKPVAWAFWYGAFNSQILRCYKQLKEDKDDNLEEYYAVTLDIANFYDTIRLSSLESKIRLDLKRSDYSTINVLFYLLGYWNREVYGYEKQVVGLPQDQFGDCSRILANYFINEFDLYFSETCKKVGATYLRFADDMVIYAKGKSQCHELVRRASLKLNSMGLNINQRKVELVSLDDFMAKRDQKYFDLLSSKSDKRNKENISRVAEVVISRGINENNDRGWRLFKRLLTCKINLLPLDQRTALLHMAYSGEFLYNKARAYDLINVNNNLTKAESRHFLDHLNSLSEVYKYNSYHYELLSFYREINSTVGERNIKHQLDLLKKEETKILKA